MKRLKVSTTEKSDLLSLRPPQHGIIRGALFLVVLVSVFACTALYALAGFDEGVAAMKADNFKLAYEEFLKAAEQGHTEAQFNLGAMYHNGEGVTQDYAVAAKWLRQAAEQGSAEAQTILGSMYHDGRGVLRNDEEAAR